VLLGAEARESAAELSYGAAAALARARGCLRAEPHWVGFGGRSGGRRRGNLEGVPIRYGTPNPSLGMNMFAIFSNIGKKKPNMNRQIELESYGIHVTWLKLCFSKEISSANITVSKKTVILAWKHRLLRGVKQRLTCRSAYYTEWEH
jgi:hypothetical protein